MEDWAVVEIDDAKVDSTNFVGNVIDLSATVPMNEFIDRMHQHPSNPHSSDYPGNCLLKFYNAIPNEETWKPSERNVEHNNDPCIIVMKRGYASDLTIGCLNSIRSFTRFYSKGQPGQMSKAVATLPRNSTWVHSPSLVTLARLSLMVRAGLRACSRVVLEPVVTSLPSMLEHGLKADLSPSLTGSK